MSAWGARRRAAPWERKGGRGGSERKKGRAEVGVLAFPRRCAAVAAGAGAGTGGGWDVRSPPADSPLAPGARVARGWSRAVSRRRERRVAPRVQGPTRRERLRGGGGARDVVRRKGRERREGKKARNSNAQSRSATSLRQCRGRARAPTSGAQRAGRSGGEGEERRRDGEDGERRRGGRERPRLRAGIK